MTKQVDFSKYAIFVDGVTSYPSKDYQSFIESLREEGKWQTYTRIPYRKHLTKAFETSEVSIIKLFALPS